MTRLLMVEDHPIFAEAVSHVLSERPDLIVVEVVGSAEKALDVISDLDLSLVLVDISLPGMNGIDLVGELSHLYPDIPCLVMSGHISRQYLSRALAAGARGYAIKDNVEGIIEGIYQIEQGKIYICKELQEA